MLRYPRALVVLSCRVSINNCTPKAQFLHPQFGVGIVSYHSFEYLFDFSSELVRKAQVSAEVAVDDRVVAVWGKSQSDVGKRDASRIRGFLSGPIIDSTKGAMGKGQTHLL